MIKAELFPLWAVREGPVPGLSPRRADGCPLAASPHGCPLPMRAPVPVS